jgi:hypothetical protein
LTKRTRDIAEKALAEGISPLEMMLKAMRELYDKGDIEKAGDMASKAAPYMHARLASIEHSGKDGGALTVQIVRYTDT